MASMSKREKLTGRKGSAPFYQAFHYIHDSAAYKGLSPSAKALLHELCRRYNGSNNGDLSAPYSELKECGWKSDKTLANHLRELQESGLVIQTRHGGTGRICNLYGLTWLRLDESSKYDAGMNKHIGKILSTWKQLKAVN
ncbi:hypothetical protein THMIRHAS_12460 [Thiosulfatimonas sediminis]|uniref:Uncharacterized protein n=1 Tax=Thiosulfatimonas sediminis TaxID=2675054 RepID=A0A6F8PUQ8_9GAMM|nr:helix-turn-helix domain-containing protein [Thiosulfatimonas sediminis]BBP45873.1 hypothetical protein THMIRHAS_12460 [Thiosulfatimonas sediminis]